MSLGLVPLAALATWRGGWWFALMPVYAWYLVTALDALLGLNGDNPDPETPADALFWHRAITVIWFPIQAAVIFWAIWYVTHSAHLGGWEKLGVFFGIGVMSGTIGMVYAHELLHQKPGLERWLGDLLAVSVPMMVLIVVGGLLYTVGAVAYGTKRPNPFPGRFGFHEVFHTCTVLAFLCHWTATLLIALDPVA